MFQNTRRQFKQWRVFWLLSIPSGILWSWLTIIDNTRLSNSASIAYLTIGFVYLVIVFVSTTIFYYAVQHLCTYVEKSKDSWMQVAKIFFVWAFVEFLVSWILAVVWIGRGGRWDTTVPFSSLTPLLMWTPFRFLTRIVGYYGLSSAFVTAVFILCLKKLRRYSLFYIGIVVSLTLIAWVIYSKPTGVSFTTTIVAEMLDQPTKLPIAGSQLVILPEYGLDKYSSSTVSSRFDTDNKVYFIGTQQLPQQNGFTNTLIFGDNKTGFQKEEQKSRLIPGGEYLPFLLEVPLRIFAPNTYMNFQVQREVMRGNTKLTPFKINNQIIIGSASCSSIITAEDYRHLVQQGATVLTNSASLEIFRGSRLFNWQHRGLSKFMAVANARPFLQSSNNWHAFALDQNGNQIAEVQPVGTSQINVFANSKTTIYTTLGEWVTFIGALWLALDAFMFIRKKYKST